MDDGMGMDDGMDEEEAPDPETKDVTFITGIDHRNAACRHLRRMDGCGGGHR